jgi:hypothetical protein
MGLKREKVIAAALAFLLFICLPGGLLGQYRRGAEITVTQKNGQRVEGELIAVKPGSLLLFSLDMKDESVDIAGIATIKILRRSKAWQGLLYGFLPGAIGGAIWGGSQLDDDMEALGAFFGGVILGAATGLVGLTAGMGLGLDQEINFAGLAQTEMDSILSRLSRLAREPGVYVPPQGISGTAAALRLAAFSHHRRPRFKLTWLPGFRVGQEGYSWEDAAGVLIFRFTDDLPPEEAGPYSSSNYSRSNDRPAFSFGRATLAYEFSRRLSAEIEIHASSYRTYHYGYLEFTSTLDGIAYVSSFYRDEVVSATSLLVGLTFRPLPPAFLQPHVFEIGVAAGPAWIGTARSEWYLSEKIDQGMAWTARGRVSYDYYFSPNLSMGAFAEYRWLQADIPSYTFTESMDFYESGNYYGNHLNRMTEMIVPGRTIALGGMACGLKFGLRF